MARRLQYYIGGVWHCDKKGPYYRDLFDIFGPHLYFRVPTFSVLTTLTQRMSIQSAMQNLHEYNNELTWSVCDNVGTKSQVFPKIRFEGSPDLYWGGQNHFIRWSHLFGLKPPYSREPKEMEKYN